MPGRLQVARTPRPARHISLNGEQICAEDTAMELRNCPYDHTPITVAQRSGGSLLLSCAVCGSQWERHGAWLRKLDEPVPVDTDAREQRAPDGGIRRPVSG